MDEKLQNLLAFVRDTDLTEVLFEQKGASIGFRRTVEPAAPAQTASPANASAATSGSDGQTVVATGPLLIRSTMVGTFYRSDSKKNHPPFVVEGTIVTAGQPVGAVEAMKIMKDVLSTQACKILKPLVENGHAVEYGQPLFEVEPVDEAPHV